MELSLVLVAMVVAVVSSALVEYVPGWTDFKHKKLAMLGLNLLTPIVIWLLVCPAQLPIGVVANCELKGLFEAIGIGVTAALGNQGAYKLFVKALVAEPRRG